MMIMLADSHQEKKTKTTKNNQRTQRKSSSCLVNCSQLSVSGTSMKMVGNRALFLVWLGVITMAFAAPTSTREERNLIVVPASSIVQLPFTPNVPPAYLKSILQQQNQQHPLAQTRGPFDFIGQWIQQVPWLPVQVNVPDLFQNIGNGINQVGTTVSQFSQNVGNGVSHLGQNIGNGVNQITQNIGNGWNQLSQNVGNGFTTWVQNVPVIGNLVGGRKPGTGNQQIVLIPMEYPGGQQLVLANEAFEAFP